MCSQIDTFALRKRLRTVSSFLPELRDEVVMTGQSRPPVTIYDVAERVGVSIATVSRALRGSPEVSETTRERVRAVAAEMQFRPNRLGQSLAEGQHAANGIVFPDLSGPYYAEVVLGYEEVLAELGRSVLILATQRRRDPDAMVVDLSRRVDGMVVMGRTVDDHVVAEIARTGVPVVLLARAAVRGLDTVNADNVRSSRALTRHLLDHGHTRFAYLGDPARSPDVAARHAAFRATVTEAGLADPPPPVPCAFDVQAGYEAARVYLSALSSTNLPEVLVCANDEVALGAVRAAQEAGIDVPGRLAVTGWDDVMAAQYAGLTTVRQPMRALGATAARWLQERISGLSTPARRHVLDTHLVVRSSCGGHDHEEESR